MHVSVFSRERKQPQTKLADWLVRQLHTRNVYMLLYICCRVACVVCCDRERVKLWGVHYVDFLMWTAASKSREYTTQCILYAHTNTVEYTPIYSNGEPTVFMMMTMLLVSVCVCNSNICFCVKHPKLLRLVFGIYDECVRLRCIRVWMYKRHRFAHTWTDEYHLLFGLMWDDTLRITHSYIVCFSVREFVLWTKNGVLHSKCVLLFRCARIVYGAFAPITVKLVCRMAGWARSVGRPRSYTLASSCTHSSAHYHATLVRMIPRRLSGC